MQVLQIKNTLKDGQDESLSFKASDSWIRKFKIYYNIVSRKITRRVTRTTLSRQEETANEEMEFVHDVRETIEDQ